MLNNPEGSRALGGEDAKTSSEVRRLYCLKKIAKKV